MTTNPDTDLYGSPLPQTTPGTSPGTVPTPTPRPLMAGMDEDDRLGYFFAQVDAVRAERVSNAYIEVSRLIDGAKKYVGRGDVASFDLESLASKWGSGRYSLQLRVGRTYRTGINVEVEGPTPAPGGVQPSLQGPAQNGTPDAGFLVQFMAQQLAAQQSMTLELIKANSAKPADSFKDELLKELLTSSLNAKSGIGQISQAMELVDRIKGSGGGGGEDDGMGGLGKLMGVVDRVLANRRPPAPAAQTPAQTRPTIAATVPAPAPAQPVAQAQANATNVAPAQASEPFVSAALTDMEARIGVPLTLYCRAIVQQIELGSDAETAAIVLYRLTIKHPSLSAIRDALGTIDEEDAARDLAANCPSLRDHAEYVREAVGGMLSLIEGDEVAEPAAAGGVA